MLALLDQGSAGSYRLPLDLIRLNDPYALGAYIAALRYATRFNEASGTFNQYLQMFGIKVDTHQGGSCSRMREAMVRLCDKHFFKEGRGAVQKLSPNQGFLLPFAPRCGWRNNDYSLGVLFSIKEVKQACIIAKRDKWEGNENLLETMLVTAYLRTYMNTTTETIAPQIRYNEAIAMVDYPSALKSLGITEKKMLTRLGRIKTAALGLAQMVRLEHKEGKEPPKDIILLVNKTVFSEKMLTKARNNLKAYYADYNLIVR